MKIYRIIFESVDIDESDNTIRVSTFFNRDNAVNYIKDKIKDLKDQEEELDMEDYCVDEDETSYERYLDGRAMEQSVSIWLEEDNTLDEIVMQTEKKVQNEEKEKDYDEM